MSNDWKLTMETRAKNLHTHIISLPQAPLTNNPWAIIDAITTFTSTSGGMMVFKGAKLSAARDSLSGMSPVPKTIIEFGTFVGCSALAWGAILKDLHGGDLSGSGCAVYSFELDPGMAGIARDFIALAGLSETVTVLEGPGAESLRGLHAEGKLDAGVDVAFFDHWEEFYLPDLQLLEELGVLRVGSKMVADNTDMPGAPKYLEYVKGGGSERVRYVSESLKTDAEPGKPSIVEISDVVSVN